MKTSRFVASGAVLVTTLVCAETVIAQRGGTKNSGPSIEQRIDARMTIHPSVTSSGTSGSLQADGVGLEYSDAESKVNCEVGDRRSIGLWFDRNPPRRLMLQLGDELEVIAGDPVTGQSSGTLDFFTSAGVPRPEGAIADVTFRIAYRENVAALGAFPIDEWRPNYCYADGTEVDDNDIDPDDPDTFSHMCTNVRIRFEVGGHKWTLYFGPPNRRVSAFFQPTHVDAGSVFVRRWFLTTTRDPLDPTVPWTIHAMPWNTGDTVHPRYGKIVGFLYYNGTRNNDPAQYAGAFDIRWADDPQNPCTVHPLQ